MDFKHHLNADALECARWAFSNEGLPNLQVFAFGDFSHNGRYASKNLLLCRDTGGPGFRAVTDEDFYLGELIRGNMDMLAACAVDSIMR